MRRREFVQLAVGTSMVWPLAARAQHKAMPVIGYLHFGSPGPFAYQLVAFSRGLAQNGYVEGQNVAIETRWAEGHNDRLPTLAADLVARKVDVIYAGGPPAAVAAKKATATIPIVFSVGIDPVATGLVASLARPGGNLTGFSIIAGDLTPKRLELLSELVPHAKLFGLLVNPDEANPGTRELEDAARAKGLQLAIVKASSEGEIDTAFATLADLHADALVIGDAVFFTFRREAARGAGRALSVTNDRAVARIRRRRRPDQLWAEPRRCRPPSRHLRGQDPQGRQAGRSPGPATDNVRAGCQSQDRQGARPHRSPGHARPRRRGHRVRQANGRSGSESPFEPGTKHFDPERRLCRPWGADEEGTQERLKGHLQEQVNPKIAEHRGRIVKNTGDRFLEKLFPKCELPHTSQPISGTTLLEGADRALIRRMPEKMMIRTEEDLMTRAPFLIVGGFVALLPLTAIAADAVVTLPNSLQWGAASPALPKGAQMAVLFGDPTKEGPFVYRLKLPAGYQVAAHMHPGDENVTVISGSVHIGMGDKLDTSKGDELPTGGYLHMPQGMHHYAWTTEETVIQNNGIGPTGITYINPADDPRKTN